MGTTNCEHRHEFVARMRGKKVRYQCADCARLGPWQKSDIPQSEGVSVPDQIDWSSMKVAELRDHAKHNEVRGYSKMNKTELVTALQDLFETGRYVTV